MLYLRIIGKTFYYENPLTTVAGQGWPRKPWFNIACCPPNIAKLIGLMPSLSFSTKDSIVAVHLYHGATLTTALEDDKASEVTVKVEGNVPWEGSVKISTQSKRSRPFTLALRIPEWARDGYSCSLQGKEENGYVYVFVESDSTIQLELPMSPKVVHAHPRTRKDDIAIVRGPLVYCAEGCDNDFELETTYVIPSKATVTEASRTEIAGIKSVPVLEIEGHVKAGWNDDGSKDLYSQSTAGWEEDVKKVKLIPYFLRENRGGNGSMRVWLHALRPLP